MVYKKQTFSCRHPVCQCARLVLDDLMHFLTALSTAPKSLFIRQALLHAALLAK
jgi:hypothetical protein